MSRVYSASAVHSIWVNTVSNIEEKPHALAAWATSFRKWGLKCVRAWRDGDATVYRISLAFGLNWTSCSP